MRPRTRPRYSPQLEALEERAVPSITPRPIAAIVSPQGTISVLVSPRPSHHHPGHPTGHGHRAGVRHGDGGDEGNPGVLPPGSNAFGKTYAEWSAAHWQWLYSIPASDNPAGDTTGADFSVGQSGHVWFLTGTFCPTTQGVCDAAHPATVTRYVTLPAGKALFFPIIDFEADNLNTDPTSPGYGTQDGGLSVSDLRAEAKGAIDLVTSLDAEIDGRSVQNLAAYRVTSPVFSYHLAANGIQGPGIPEQTVSPAVSDGYFLLLAPLSAGQHTIHFAASVPAANFALDVTYHITVRG
jgi:hypothetical protein